MCLTSEYKVTIVQIQCHFRTNVRIEATMLYLFLRINILNLRNKRVISSKNVLPYIRKEYIL